MSPGPRSEAAQFAEDALWPPTWVEGAGEATIRARQQHPPATASSPHRRQPPAKLYCGWFCPYAQRAWIACEAKGIDYQYVEVNPYSVDPSRPGGYTKKALPLEVKRVMYPEFVCVSPRGLVPAMDVAGEHVHESLPLIEYIDERFDGVPLLPPTAAGRARVRIWISHCDSIFKAYYGLLMQQTAAGQAKAKVTMLEQIRKLAGAMSEDGPFFLGSQFSLFEAAVAPFWQRYLWVGSHYRGLSFPDEPAFARMARWWDACEKHPAVAATLVSRPRLVSSYSDYATNSATSEVARTIQKGLNMAGRGGAAPRVRTATALLTLGSVVGLVGLVAVTSRKRTAGR